MKCIIGAVLILIPFINVAQPKMIPPASSSSLRPVIEKVARDFYQNFNNIKGDTVNESENTIQFKSKIAPAGAIATSITKYVGPYSYLWQTIMFQSEDYQPAVDRYKEYFRQLNGTALTFYDKSSYKLKGSYDIPDESRSFASSILQLDSTNRDLRLFKVEVALNYTMPEWTVKVMVYEKIADKDVRPTIN
jgi:hypothetical protein